MNMELHGTYHGFELVRREAVPELKSLALQFRHAATGAQLLVLENDDDNKVFSVTFRTPPANDRGVAHILEHSVLCGSRKYPVKEPFMEMVKGSLKTFLNAMTFPDKTMYPVASRNRKDLFNLMSVYLDAVFFPKITRETFMQEGWHHELETAGGEIVYKGVVFNEMKGAFSDPESLIDRYLSHALFPDTVYGHESGGDPERIPDLTYEEFLAFHRKYYHPANSRLFLYGDGCTLDYLQFIQEGYLQEFAGGQADSRIALQKRFQAPRRKTIPYSIARGEPAEKKTYVTLGLLLGRADDREHCLAFTILSHLLLGTPASPLRKALIDSGLGSEVVGGGFDDQRAETSFAVGLKGTEKENEEKILALIDSTLTRLAENGIDENMVTAAVNSVDFRLREANYGGFPKGIVYNIQSLGSWLYDADPLMHLKYEDLMNKIKKASPHGYFEDLIRRHLLGNPHRCVITALPRPGLTEEKDEKTWKKLQDFKASLKADEVTRLVATTKRLQELQQIPDAPEALATLPKLRLDDLERNSTRYPLDGRNGNKILFHDLFTNRIGYVQVGFDARAVPMDKIPYLSLLGTLILEMGTKKHDYVEISQMLGIHTGGIRTSHFSSAHLSDPGRILSYMFFNGKAVMDKLDKLFDLYAELLGDYEFDNPKRLLEIVRSAKADMEASIVPTGNRYVAARLNSYHSRIGKYDEIAGGLTSFYFLEDLLRRVEKNPQEVAAEFRQVAECIFTRDNMLVNITSEAADYPVFEKKVNALAERFPERNGAPVTLEFPPQPANEAFLTASSVQYVGRGANLYSLGFTYTGHFNVLRSVLNTGFLWEKVRMQGGAYGCSASLDVYSGDFGLVSYRDPNLSGTLAVYDEIAGFIAGLELSPEELEKSIVGCVGNLDPCLSPDRKGYVAMVEHLTGLAYETKQQYRDQVLSTTLKDIKAFAGVFEELQKTGSVCVLGNEDKIRESAGRFDHLVNVFR